MREIKFRAWDKNKNKMIYVGEQWASTYGVLIDSFEDDDLMQYTGLKDKNGKDIYECDIVKYDDNIRHWDGDYSKPTLVEYTDGSFTPFCGCGSEYSMNAEKSIIIGNIYENPELLNAKQ